MSDHAVLEMLGRRLAKWRIDLQMTQAVLAEQAGVSKRTVERVEAGKTAQTQTLVRILRALGLMEGMEQLVPEIGPRPMDLLKLDGRERKRASSPKSRKRNGPKWTWGDEE
jgi:transcriptional regulator with XRE-family HTH domain